MSSPQRSPETPDEHYFTMFGIDCVAPFPMPMCTTRDQPGERTLRIAFGACPRVLPDTEGPARRKPYQQIGGGQLLQQIPERDIWMWLRSADELVIDAQQTEAVVRLIRPVVLATIASAVITLRGGVPIHASGLVFDDRLVLVSGRSGDGKSTLAAAALATGSRYISDDLVAWSASDGFTVGIPALKVSPDSRALFAQAQIDTSTSLDSWGTHSAWVSDERKEWLDGAQRFDEVAPQMSALVVLDNASSSAARLSRVRGAGALVLARRRAMYRWRMLDALVGPAEVMARTARLAAAVPIYRFERERSGARLLDDVELLRGLSASFSAVAPKRS